MAEGICRKQFCDILGCSVDELEDFGYIIGSAGVAAIAGMPASLYAVEVCRQHGIPLGEHESVPLTRRQIDENDRLFVMSRGHLQSILEFYPPAAEKCFLLDAGGDIADPAGQGVEVYRRCFKQIEKAVKQRVSEIL
jgi:protein-tyrosine phosphatase